MSLYEFTVPQLKTNLQALDKWLDAAVAFAESKKFEPNTLLSARLAPDQFPLVRQIQSTCDQAKLTCARLTGKTPPVHPDTEETIDQLRTRIRSVIEYLGTFTRGDFADSEARKISLPWFQGKHLLGIDYLNQQQLPNFYFHFSHAYAILRHNGVPLGKADFITALNLRD